MTKKLSGLQQEVISLYRKILRVAIDKDRHQQHEIKPSFMELLQPNRMSSLSFASQEFRQQSSRVKRTDFETIEHMIRRGNKQLKLLKMPGVNMVGGASSYSQNSDN